MDVPTEPSRVNSYERETTFTCTCLLYGFLCFCNDEPRDLDTYSHMSLKGNTIMCTNIQVGLNATGVVEFLHIAAPTTVSRNHGGSRKPEVFDEICPRSSTKSIFEMKNLLFQPQLPKQEAPKRKRNQRNKTTQ